VWWSIDPDSREGAFTLSELPVSDGWEPIRLEQTLGRRWRKDAPGFWDRLSPLGADPTPVPSAPFPRPVSRGGPVDLQPGGINGSMHDRDADDECEEVGLW
jgi:hypothetical protein